MQTAITALDAKATQVRDRIAWHMRAIGQTFFIEDSRFGAVTVMIVAVFAPMLALCGLIASVGTRLLVDLLGANRTVTDAGFAELNGWFLGLACASFFAPGLGLVAALFFGMAANAVFVVVLHRVLATWDLPVMVAPYMPAFWLVWLAFAGLKTMPVIASSGVLADGGGTVQAAALGALRGLGQIFFLPDARVGLCVAVAVAFVDWRIAIVMTIASTMASLIAWGIGAPFWQIEQGLHGFAAALTGAAVLKGFRGLDKRLMVVAVVAAPVLELAALKLSSGFGVYGLSSGYVALIWLATLSAPKRRESALHRAWS